MKKVNQKKLKFLSIFIYLFFLLESCDLFLTPEKKDDHEITFKKSNEVKNNIWTWVSGSNTINQIGNYGDKCVANGTNIPGARSSSISWIDSDGNLWLFGGYGYDVNGDTGYLNDLWKFDGTLYAWISGNDTRNQQGIYGSKGLAHEDNIPGSRSFSISWIDSDNNLWLFGGYGCDVNGDTGFLNDLWKFDGTLWTWVTGSNTINQAGVYSDRTPVNIIPGARTNSISWIDSDNNLWLFGGIGNDVNGDAGHLNDLWKFDGSAWAWILGGQTINQYGVYGTKGIPDALNTPGSRTGSINWIDSEDHLWLFGGLGPVYGEYYFGYYNDLWKFDGKCWIWISGSNNINQAGVYGIKGNSAISNMPGSRVYSISWIDDSDNFWLFGGIGYDVIGEEEKSLNDLWKFDGINWTWISGNNVANEIGIYGTKGIANNTNIPGARDRSISWIDLKDNLWLFGGWGSDNYGNIGYLNDLWKFKL